MLFRSNHGVNPRGDGDYEVECAGTPHVVASLTSWLSERSHPLRSLDAGRENLEDAYRRITGGDR